MNDLIILEEFIRETLLDEAGRKKKKGKRKAASKRRASKKGKSKVSRRKSSAGGLSTKTKETLKKKADAKGYTAASVYAEYRAGLAAWVTGHRPGVSQHQWAMARVNSATPSKPWAKVKKKKK
jgi:outer membrane cobalamin receptor